MHEENKIDSINRSIDQRQATLEVHKTYIPVIFIGDEGHTLKNILSCRSVKEGKNDS